jgi:hypothetical protein
MNIKEKIAARLENLEKHLVAGDHLKSDEGAVAVSDLISSIAKFASILSSADRDFLNAAKVAVSEKKPWI